VVGTDIVNPDFTALGKAYGAHTETVRKTEEFPAALERSIKAGKLSLIEVFIDRDALTPNLTLSQAGKH
jgi:acetolactate synthase-1/2/3 large subunit